MSVIRYVVAVYWWSESAFFLFVLLDYCCVGKMIMLVL